MLLDLSERLADIIGVSCSIRLYIYKRNGILWTNNFFPFIFPQPLQIALGGNILLYPLGERLAVYLLLGLMYKFIFLPSLVVGKKYIHIYYVSL